MIAFHFYDLKYALKLRSTLSTFNPDGVMVTVTEPVGVIILGKRVIFVGKRHFFRGKRSNFKLYQNNTTDNQ